VTLVGMDNAVVDIVSLVTILQDRKLGVHDGNFDRIEKTKCPIKASLAHRHRNIQYGHGK
ncbi:hypothetical protein BD408DRAFT_347378, partial [Parasitella parasitica]